MKHREFTWKENEEQEDIGYIAQELEEIDNNYVSHNYKEDEDGNITMDRYEVRILPILATATKAIQEQQVIIKQQQEQIEKQKQFIELVKEKLNMQEEYNEIFSTKTTIKRASRKEQETVYTGEVINRQKEIKKVNPKEKLLKYLENGNIEISERERQEAKANGKG